MAVEDDFTGAVCLLHKLTKKYPTYEQILIDAADFQSLSQFEWRIAEVGRIRVKRAVRRTDFAYLHRVLMEAPDHLDVDHRFHNTLDNRRRHLRICTAAENNLNTRRHKGGTSRFKGVQLCKQSGKWRVQCGRRGKRVFLGSFYDEIEAAKVYNEYAKREYGDLACLNDV